MGHALVPMVARGPTLGPDQPVILHLLGRFAESLKGVEIINVCHLYYCVLIRFSNKILSLKVVNTLNKILKCCWMLGSRV